VYICILSDVDCVELLAVKLCSLLLPLFFCHCQGLLSASLLASTALCNLKVVCCIMLLLNSNCMLSADTYLAIYTIYYTLSAYMHTAGRASSGGNGAWGDNTQDTSSGRSKDTTKDKDPELCAICEEGGDVLLCEGPCKRSFHPACSEVCTTLQLTIMPVLHTYMDACFAVLAAVTVLVHARLACLAGLCW
jgi:hypothetical protein